MYVPSTAILLALLTTIDAAPTASTTINTNLLGHNTLFERKRDGLEITYLPDNSVIRKRTWPLWPHDSGKGCSCPTPSCLASSGSGSGSGSGGAGVGAGGSATGGGSGMICISGDLAGQLMGGGGAGAGAGVGGKADGDNTNATSPYHKRTEGNTSADTGAGAGASGGGSGSGSASGEICISEDLFGMLSAAAGVGTKAGWAAILDKLGK